MSPAEVAALMREAEPSIAFAVRKIDCAAKRDDLAQDIRAAVLESLPQWDEVRGTIATWAQLKARGTIYRNALRWKRASRWSGGREVSLDGLMVVDGEERPQHEPVDEAPLPDVQAEAARALALASPADREVLIAYYIRGETSDEIARAHGVAMRAMQQRITTAVHRAQGRARVNTAARVARAQAQARSNARGRARASTTIRLQEAA